LYIDASSSVPRAAAAPDALRAAHGLEVSDLAGTAVNPTD
jgi:hypothetical protein